MWDRLCKQVAVEREQLTRLLDMYRPLLAKCGVGPPDYQAYSFQLRWDKMAALVLDCEKVMKCLEAELDVFTQSGRKENYPGC